MKNLKYISLVNLILDKPILTELIQEKMNVDNIEKELSALLDEGKERTRLLNGYQDVRTVLGGGGVSSRIVRKIVNLLQRKN